MAAVETERRAPSQLPGIGEFLLPLNRNDLLLLLVAFTEAGTGFETLLAHLISGGVKPMEWIPVLFGPAAGLLLALAVVLRVARKDRRASTLLLLATAAASVGVGVLGSAFHWSRAFPDIPGVGVRFDWIVFAPPILAPLSFAGVGLLAILAVLEDTRPESGRLTLPGVLTFNTPLTQTRQFLWLVAFGMVAATVSAFLDHGRTGFENPAVWIPVVLGTFGAVATFVMALYERHTAADYFTFFWTMVLMILVGVMGFALHVNADLPDTGTALVPERFIQGAPVMAPMLFAIVGAFGIVTMVDAPVDEPAQSA